MRESTDKNLFITSTVVTCATALFLQFTGCFQRIELQSINGMFEARQWLKWSAEGWRRLNPKRIWRYHEAHEIPRRVWAWDYTLSWLIAENHPSAANKIVIFNHMLEDEPPLDAVREHPWMQPLMHHPLPRTTMAEVVRLLARNGAKAIILDNDFPQYTDGDAALASAIHDAGASVYGRSVPVLMASTLNRRAFQGGLQLQAITLPVGVLSELQKLEPTTDVAKKYCGITTILIDEDQVVRRIATRLPTQTDERESIIVKALHATGQPIPPTLPECMDIDFAAAPNTELFPVRPFHYLLDPEMQKQITSGDSKDVTVRDAVVIIGDGVQDVYPTPLANTGINSMSGSEILANAIDSISRQSWPHRLKPGAAVAYLLSTCIACAVIFTALRRNWQSSRFKPTVRMALDWSCCILLSACTYGIGFVWFTFAGLIVPVVSPAVAVGAGVLAGVLYERERERLYGVLTRLNAMEATLKAERHMHEAQLRMQEAEAKAKEVILDQQRRTEFVRRINHDLKAPVTVLNWTLAKLMKEGLSSAHAHDRLDHVGRTADRLFALIAELVRSYDQTPQLEKTDQEPGSTSSDLVDLSTLVADCARIQLALAEMRKSTITIDAPPYAMPTVCPRLQLERVIDNILRNALMHNPPGTTVEISARTRANVHQIIITDNGLGIPAAQIEKIFDAGFSTSADESGEGLGLHIVKSIVERLGGTVTVSSEEEFGTTFTVTLPANSALPAIIDAAPLNANHLATTNRG